MNLSVCHLLDPSEKISIKQLSVLMDGCEKNKLAHVPWVQFPYRPKVHFAIAYNEASIFLKYYVTEKSIRAVNKINNSSVWEDSCVEFFIAFDETHYYNIEVNCIGTVLLGYGRNKIDRCLLPDDTVGKIKTLSVIDEEIPGAIEWELTIAIPNEVFIYDNITGIKGKKISANFYKCGDMLPEPHFLAWNNIQSPEPDFHLPAYFGQLLFE
jgi:hypothetical protein